MSTKPDAVTDEVVFCDRCGTILHPGHGDFYEVRIEAVADPTPPVLQVDEAPADLPRRLDELLAQMKDLSAQEAMDQVYRRVVLYLCLPCYRLWIENPTGTV